MDTVTVSGPMAAALPFLWMAKFAKPIEPDPRPCNACCREQMDAEWLVRDDDEVE